MEGFEAVVSAHGRGMLQHVGAVLHLRRLGRENVKKESAAQATSPIHRERKRDRVSERWRARESHGRELRQVNARERESERERDG